MLLLEYRQPFLLEYKRPWFQTVNEIRASRGLPPLDAAIADLPKITIGDDVYEFVEALDAGRDMEFAEYTKWFQTTLNSVFALRPEELGLGRPRGTPWPRTPIKRRVRKPRYGPPELGEALAAHQNYMAAKRYNDWCFGYGSE